MIFCYNCLRFPAVLVMLVMVVPSLDLYLIPLWCRDLCVSLCASCGWACTWARFHSVVHHGAQVICCMPPSLLLTDWSPTDGSTANHWCDPSSLEVKANLSGFPGLWASTLLQFFWVTNEASILNRWCYFARDWVVLLSPVCAVL